MGDNRCVRRGLVLTCLWVLGVSASVGLAFAAVGRVANRVAPPAVAKLSSQGVDRALGSTVPSSSPTTPRGPSSSTPSTTTTGGSPTSTATTGPSGPSRPGGPTSTLGTEPPTTNGSSGPVTTVGPPSPTTTTPTPTTTAPTNTVTTSQGGTVWTRCSSNEQIVYIAAVPKSGYERTRDVENPSGIVQSFDDGSHRSTISAECSNGVVHAEIEEEREGADFAPPSEDLQSSM